MFLHISLNALHLSLMNYTLFCIIVIFVSPFPIFFLQIPYDKKEDKRMNELIELAHQFLQNFCLGDRQNQALLYKRIDLFLNPGVGINRNTYME